jgi:LysM repeat protein
MNFRKLLAGGCAIACMAAGLCGCLPSGSDPQEEQKEPHFLAGKARVNSLDYHGAVESFQKALEVNPRSASAHFELGWLFNDKESDPAAAIYHYESYLKLRPNADNAELVRQRINTCKLDLAKAVLPLPVTPGLQREFEHLAEENRRLKEEVARWQTYAASQPRTVTNAATPVLVMTRPTTDRATGGNLASTNRPESGAVTASVPKGRTHLVKAGDSPYSIAKQYGVKLNSLLAVNPSLDPKRLKVGQTVNIPLR